MHQHHDIMYVLLTTINKYGVRLNIHLLCCTASSAVIHSFATMSSYIKLRCIASVGVVKKHTSKAIGRQIGMMASFSICSTATCTDKASAFLDSTSMQTTFYRCHRSYVSKDVWYTDSRVPEASRKL